MVVTPRSAAAARLGMGGGDGAAKGPGAHAPGLRAARRCAAEKNRRHRRRGEGTRGSRPRATRCRRCAAGRDVRRGRRDLGLAPPGFALPPLRGWPAGSCPDFSQGQLARARETVRSKHVAMVLLRVEVSSWDPHPARPTPRRGVPPLRGRGFEPSPAGRRCRAAADEGPRNQRETMAIGSGAPVTAPLRPGSRSIARDHVRGNRTEVRGRAGTARGDRRIARTRRARPHGGAGPIRDRRPAPDPVLRPARRAERLRRAFDRRRCQGQPDDGPLRRHVNDRDRNDAQGPSPSPSSIPDHGQPAAGGHPRSQAGPARRKLPADDPEPEHDRFDPPF